MTARGDKVRLWRCGYCSGYFPAEHIPTLTLHIQRHIERSARQQAGNHTCLCKARNKHKRGELCEIHFHTPTALAIHMLENHTQKKDVHEETTRHQKATILAAAEKEKLITLLGETENTPDRLFHPRENKNGPRLGIDNMDFQEVLDNMASIKAREGLH